MRELRGSLMVINRTRAMPNSKIFSIKPIGELAKRYVSGEKIIVDPFANGCHIGTITTELSKEDIKAACEKDKKIASAMSVFGLFGGGFGGF